MLHYGGFVQIWRKASFHPWPGQSRSCGSPRSPPAPAAALSPQANSAHKPKSLSSAGKLLQKLLWTGHFIHTTVHTSHTALCIHSKFQDLKNYWKIFYLWILICSWALAGRQDAKGGSWLTYCLKQQFKALTFQPYPRQCNSKPTKYLPDSWEIFLYIERGHNNIQSGYDLNLFLIGIRMKHRFWAISCAPHMVPPLVESDNVLASWFCNRHFLKSAKNFYWNCCDAFVLSGEMSLNRSNESWLQNSPPLRSSFMKASDARSIKADFPSLSKQE